MIELLESKAVIGKGIGETVTLTPFEESVLVAHGRAKYVEAKQDEKNAGSVSARNRREE